MKTMKKILAILTVCVLIVGSFAGCGGLGGGNKGGAALTGEYIIVKCTLNGLKEEWMKNAAAAFTYETGIQVQFEFESGLSESVTTTLETPGLPLADLYFVQTHEWAKWAEAGYMRDLTKLMNTKDENGKSLNDRLIGNDRYLLDAGEKVNYTVPLTYAPTAIAYNKPIMNYVCHDLLGWEAGHDYPVNTKELDEVVAALQKATAEGKNPELLTYTQSGQTYNVQPLVWSGSTGMLEMIVYPWIYQYMGVDGVEAYYSQTKDLQMLGHDAFYVAYQKMVDLLAIDRDANGDWNSTTSVPGCPSFNHVTSQQRFVRGQGLLCPTGSWFYTETADLIAELNMGDKIGFMPVPWLSDAEGNYLIEEGATPAKDKNGNPGAITRINNVDFMFIPERAECPELAEQFLLFLFSEEYMPKLCQDLQSPMCFEFDDSTVEKSPWFAEVDKVLDAATPIESWACTKLCNYGRIGIYYNPDVAPFSRLIQCSFGSNSKLVDSATGKTINSAAEATGIAVTENVYKYLLGNYQRGLKAFQDSKKELGV